MALTPEAKTTLVQARMLGLEIREAPVTRWRERKVLPGVFVLKSRLNGRRTVYLPERPKKYLGHKSVRCHIIYNAPETLLRWR